MKKKKLQTPDMTLCMSQKQTTMVSLPSWSVPSLSLIWTVLSSLINLAIYCNRCVFKTISSFTRVLPHQSELTNYSSRYIQHNVCHWSKTSIPLTTNDKRKESSPPDMFSDTLFECLKTCLYYVRYSSFPL